MRWLKIGKHKYINYSKIVFIEFMPSRNKYSIITTEGVIEADEVCERSTADIEDEKEK